MFVFSTDSCRPNFRVIGLVKSAGTLLLLRWPRLLLFGSGGLGLFVIDLLKVDKKSFSNRPGFLPVVCHGGWGESKIKLISHENI